MSATRTSIQHTCYSCGVVSSVNIAASIDFDEDHDVILLDADFLDGMALRSSLQAMGVHVHLGPHSIEANSLPLILYCAANRQQLDVKSRLKHAQDRYPKAAVVLITGNACVHSIGSYYTDARKLLCAAGIGFASIPSKSM